jgi:hypothetical protein
MTKKERDVHNAALGLVISLDRELMAKKSSSAGSAGSMRAEVRSVRDATDEYESYLVFVADGKSYPYLHIPEDMPDEILQQALAKLNA